MDQRKLSIAEQSIKDALERKHGQAEKLVDLHLRIPLAQYMLLKHFALEVGMNPMHYMLAQGMKDGLSRQRTLPFSVTLALGKGVPKRANTHPDYASTLQHLLLENYDGVIPNFKRAGTGRKRRGIGPENSQPPELFSGLDGEQLREANKELNELDDKLAALAEEE